MPGRGNRPVVEENGMSTVAVLSSERWRRLVPVAFVTCSFGYLDRSNYLNGSVGGLTDRLRIAGNMTASPTPRRNRSVSSNQ